MNTNNNNNNNNKWDQFQSTPKLLPPTVFEKTTIESSVTDCDNTTTLVDNQISYDEHNSTNRSGSQFCLLSNELEKMKNELRKLHTENDQLRLKNRDFVEQAQLYTETSGYRQISIKALEELIHKQTREIQELKSSLINEREESTRKLKENEAEWQRKNLEHQAKLVEVDTERKKACETYQNSLLTIKSENDVLTKTQTSKIQKLMDENKTLSDEYKKEVSKMTKTIEELRSECLVKDQKIECVNRENEKLKTELENLKNYVNNSMPTIDTVKEITKEKEQVDEEILKIKMQNDNLIKENNSIQIRLKSINQILTIQENQLEASQLTTSGATNAIYNEKKRQGLLNRWRTKVFELLIQLKSAEISSKQDKHMADRTLQDYLERLEDAINRNKIFENIIEDKKAELSVVIAEKSALTQDIQSLKEANASLEKKHKQDLESSLELKHFVTGLMTQYQSIEKSFKLADKKLSHLDKRIEFARDRLVLIKTLYGRKEIPEVKRGNVLDMTTNLSTIYGSIDPNESHFNPVISLEQGNSLLLLKGTSKLAERSNMDSDEENLLRKELNMVHEERNLLATKLQNDIEVMEENEVKLKAEYGKKISLLEERIDELIKISKEKDDKITEISDLLVVKSNACESLNKNYEACQKELNEIKEQLDSEYESQLKKKDLEYGDRLVKMDEKLNDARREQAKAVVVMRQMERSTNREKERLENLLKSCDEYYKDHVNKLQIRIVSLEKERNTLISNLRGASSQGMSNFSSQEFESIFNNNNNNNNKTSYLPSVSIEKAETTTEVTSFWLSSKEKSACDEEEVENKYVDTNNRDEETDEFDESDSNKDSEILQQIRKIMGNLELSDIEDESENNRDEKNDEKNGYLYETEHAIDEESVFKNTDESFSN